MPEINSVQSTDRVWTSGKQVALDALRAEARRRLELLDARSNDNFARYFPEGINGMDREKLEGVINLINRTLVKHGILP